MEIREAIEVLKEGKELRIEEIAFRRKSNYKDKYVKFIEDETEAFTIAINILSQINDAEMPLRQDTPRLIQQNEDWRNGFNACNDLWQSFHLKKMGERVNLIEQLLNKYCHMDF